LIFVGLFNGLFLSKADCYRSIRDYNGLFVGVNMFVFFEFVV